MYKINDFSLITGVSKDTLRYYDKINFFNPSYVDIFSNYRYYEENQIDEIKKINNLKELGLSLEDIKKYLNTGDNNILKEKKKEMIKIMEKINKIMEENECIYSITKSNYDEYVIVNGTKNADTPQALEVRDNNALYFVIYKNDKLYTDFCVYKEKNWLTLNDNYLNDKDLLNFVFSELRKYISNVTLYIPAENVKTISFLTNCFKENTITDFKQDKWLYKQIEIKI